MPEYYGYPNRATWVVGLWVDNDEYWQEEVVEEAKHLLASEGEEAASKLAVYLREEVETQAEESLGNNGLLVDLLNQVLDEVDWRFLADEWLTQAKEEAEGDSND